MAEHDYVDERISRIERGCREVLASNGYPTEPDAMAEECQWRRLQRQARTSRTPYDERARRALAGLLLVRQLRDALAAGDADRATRHALDLGPLEHDTLSHALAIATNRARGIAGANQKREAAKQRRRNQVRQLADAIQTQRRKAGAEPLTHAILAAHIHRTGPKAIMKLSKRTIRDYLA